MVATAVSLASFWSHRLQSLSEVCQILLGLEAPPRRRVVEQRRVKATLSRVVLHRTMLFMLPFGVFPCREHILR